MKKKQNLEKKEDYSSHFRILMSLSIATLVAFFALFVIICLYSLGDGDAGGLDDHILGHFDSTGAAILIIGFPALMLFTTYIYLKTYRK